MLIAYLVIMAFLLSNSNENDTFIKSLYFYTITMTTVGLGDIAVIGQYNIFFITTIVIIISEL